MSSHTATYSPLPAGPCPVAPRDHVLVPNGRSGEVIGFYRNEADLVLVRLEDGESRPYTRAEVRLLTANPRQGDLP